MGTNKGTRTRSSSSKNGSKSTKRNTNTSRKTNTKNTKSRSDFSNMVTVDDSIRDEAILLAILAVSILLYLALFNVLGKFGNVLNGILYGLFGLTSFVIPVIVFLSAAFFISNRGQSVAYIKVIAATLLVVILSAFAQLIFDKDFLAEKITDYYVHSGSSKRGGGLLGGIVTHMLEGTIGRAGAYVVLIVLLIICIIIITERSFFNGVKHGSATIYNSARDNSERAREQRRIRQLEREEIRRERMIEREAELAERQAKREEELQARRRSEKVVTGVSLDTALVKGNESSDDMHEIVLDDSALAKSGYTSELESNIINETLRQELVNSSNLRKEHAISISTLDDDLSDNDLYEDEIKTEEENTVRLSNKDDAAYNRKLKDDMHEITFDDVDNVSVLKENIPAKLNNSVVNTTSKPSSAEGLSGNVNISTMNNPNANVAIDKISDADVIKPDVNDVEIKNKPVVNKKAGGEYKFPPIELLKAGKKNNNMESSEELKETAAKLQSVLKTFNVNVTITDIAQGPTVTRYEMLPELGTKVSKITGLADDIKLNLAAQDVRIEAPIPGKAAVGIEIPNKVNATVMFRDLLEHKNFKEASSKLSFAVGKDLSGDTIVADIAKMPHMLIAGSTGSGKSVCINTLIMSIIYKAKPDEVKLIMVDPKVVELSVYNGIPHLMIPVVTDPKKAAAALNWGVAEMTDRYNKFAEFGVRDLKGYNKKLEQLPVNSEDERPKKLPQIVIIVDELADLMMVASKEVEESICRLAQLARAAGIHLIIATQRPSVDVITGLIKANMPSRVAFAVSSGTDSRTILDMNGAEKLLGKGDMLFYPQGYPKPTRLQGAFISDDEIADIVDFLKEQSAGENVYNEEVLSKVNASASSSGGNSSGGGGSDSVGSDKDDLFIQAAQLVIEQDKASIGFFQRKFKIGFNRAARIMDQLAEAGVVGEEEGTKPRKVIMSMEQFENALEQGEI